MTTEEPFLNDTDDQLPPDEVVDHRPAPPGEHQPNDQRPAPPEPRPAPPQSVESKPPPPQQPPHQQQAHLQPATVSQPAPPQQQPPLQPTASQPPPPQQQWSGYQQPASEYPSQPQPQYQYPQQNGYQQPGYQQPPPQTSGRRSPLPIVIAAIALLIPIGVGGWYVFGRNDDTPQAADEPDDPKTTKPSATDDPGADEPDEPDATEPDATEPETTEPATTEPETTEPETTEPETSEATAGDFPTNPQLKVSVSVNMDPDETWIRVASEGTADDLFIGEPGATASTVTRYVDGQPKWEVQVGLGGTGFLRQEGDYLFFASTTPDYEGDSIVRLDPETGATMWEITSKKDLWFRFVDDRMFVVEEEFGESVDQTIFEYDPATGAQLNSIGGPEFELTNDQYVLVRPDTSTVQPLNIDLQPDGSPVTLEPSGVENGPPVIFAKHDGGWVYYTNRTSSGGGPTVVGLSPTGDKQFECPVTLEEPGEITVRDDSTLVLADWGAIDVLDFDGTSCSPRWSYQTPEDTNDDVDTYSRYPRVRHFNYGGADDGLIDTDIDVLDWRNGGVITTGKDVAYINDDDQMITFVGDQLVSRGLRNDDILWSIDAPGDTGVSVSSGMIIIVTNTGAGATVDIYAD